MTHLRRTITGLNDVATTEPEFAKRFSPKSPLKPHQVTPNSNRKALFTCANNHEWEARVATVFNGGGCVYCANLKTLPGFNDLETIFPSILEIYSTDNPLKPNQIIAGGKTKYLWKCNKCHGVWNSNCTNQYRSRGCPYCNNVKLLSGYNDFHTRYPQQAKQWSSKNIKKAKEVFPFTNKQYWFTCTQHGDWKTTPNKIALGTQCPQCAIKQFRSKGEKELFSFLTKYATAIPNDRIVLKGLEIDIYLPTINIGIEYNGDYWHSEKIISQIYDQTAYEYHHNKALKGKTQGTKLLFVWESDWKTRKEDVQAALKRVIANSNDIDPLINIISKG